MNAKNIFIVVIAFLIAVVIAYVYSPHHTNLPIVAIANWGPHSSLDDAISGVKKELEKQGFIEGKNLLYEISDVGFDASLIPQMITTLKSHHPKVMVVVATPVAQYAKGAIKNIPLIYSVVTDPVEAELIKDPHKPDKNMTGSSDQQDLKMLLNFAKKIIPQAKTVGLLYATAESNDLALLKMMRKSAAQTHMNVVAIPVDQARDVPIAMQHFKNKVDFIYVGASGPIQPTLPVIAAESMKMGIPVLNVNQYAVEEGLVLGSFGVDYKQVGVNTGKLVAEILKGRDISQLTPLYPESKDYRGLISRNNAKKLGIFLPPQGGGAEGGGGELRATSLPEYFFSTPPSVPSGQLPPEGGAKKGGSLTC